jgi:hypothetical protein
MAVFFLQAWVTAVALCLIVLRVLIINFVMVQCSEVKVLIRIFEKNHFRNEWLLLFRLRLLFSRKSFLPVVLKCLDSNFLMLCAEDRNSGRLIYIQVQLWAHRWPGLDQPFFWSAFDVELHFTVSIVTTYTGTFSFIADTAKTSKVAGRYRSLKFCFQLVSKTNVEVPVYALNMGPSWVNFLQNSFKAWTQETVRKRRYLFEWLQILASLTEPLSVGQLIVNFWAVASLVCSCETKFANHDFIVVSVVIPLANVTTNVFVIVFVCVNPDFL